MYERASSLKYVVKELDEIRKNYLQGKRKDSKYFVPQPSPISFPKKELAIDPYILGALIGDGSIKNQTSFTSGDSFIVEEISRLLTDGYSVYKIPSKEYGYTIRKEKYNGKFKNKYTEELKSLGLFGKGSHTKFIPIKYKEGDFNQRLSLLQGMMDTDGMVGKSGSMSYTTVSEKLKNDFMEVARSLGIVVSCSKRTTTYGTEKRFENYRINIKTGLPIVRLPRKVSRLNTTPSAYAKTNRNKVAIVKIEKLEVMPSVCISVDNEDKLFLVNDYVVTHNSMSVGAGLTAHEFLFDGMTEYSLNLVRNPPSAEILVGAGDAKYSADLLDKTKTALEMLPGGYETTDRLGNPKVYPSPLAKNFVGSWKTSGQITATYKKKIGGRWINAGSKSNIKNRSFNDNPYAANGTRPGLMLWEEIGMFNNLLESYASAVECQRDGSLKFGSMMFLGTGGAFESGGTADAYEMFYHPDKYDIISFNDV